MNGAFAMATTLGSEAVREQNAKWAADGIQPGAQPFGVKHGDIPARGEADRRSGVTAGS